MTTQLHLSIALYMYKLHDSAPLDDPEQYNDDRYHKQNMNDTTSVVTYKTN